MKHKEKHTTLYVKYRTWQRIKAFMRREKLTTENQAIVKLLGALK